MDAVFNWAGDSRVNKYMIYPLYKSPEDGREWLSHLYEDEKKIDISLSKSAKGFFGSIVGKEIYTEKCSYTGYFKDEEKIIEKKVN